MSAGLARTPRGRMDATRVERMEFERGALEHLDAVYRMALQLARRPEEAEDLVQETYLRALRAAPTFAERGGGMKPWLLTILHHAFYSRGARDARAPIAVDEFHGLSDERETAPGDAPPAWDLKSLDWEQVDDRLKTAINGLSDDHRVILLLWGVEGMRYRDIAAIVGVPVGTVMSRLHRARKILADELEAFRGELGLMSQRQVGSQGPESKPKPAEEGVPPSE